MQLGQPLKYKSKLFYFEEILQDCLHTGLKILKKLLQFSLKVPSISFTPLVVKKNDIGDPIAMNLSTWKFNFCSKG